MSQAPVLAELVSEHGGTMVYERGAREAEEAAFEAEVRENANAELIEEATYREVDEDAEPLAVGDDAPSREPDW